MPVIVKLYTEEDLHEGLPSGHWEHRLLFNPEKPGEAKLMEVFSLGNGKVLSTDASEYDVDPALYRAEVKADGGKWPKYKKNFVELFNPLFHIVPDEEPRAE